MRSFFFFAWIIFLTGFYSLSFSNPEEQASQPSKEDAQPPIQKYQKCDPQDLLGIPTAIF